MTKTRKITFKEKQFIRHYLQTGSIKRTAARLNVSTAEARTIKNRKIVRKAIKRFVAKECESLKLDKESFVERLKKISDCHIGQFLDWDKYGVVTIKSKKELAPEQLFFIDQIKPTKYGLEVKFKDQIKVMEQIAKMLGMFAPEKIEVKKTSCDNLRKPRLYKLTREELDTYKKLILKMYPEEEEDDTGNRKLSLGEV